MTFVTFGFRSKGDFFWDNNEKLFLRKAEGKRSEYGVWK